MKTHVYIVCFFLCKLSSSFAQEIFIKNNTGDLIELNVSEKKVIFYGLIGIDKDLKNAGVDIQTPSFFKIITNTPRIASLKVGELKDLFFTIQCDPNTPFGEYKTIISILEDGQVRSQFSLKFKVLKNHKIEVFPLEKPDQLSQKQQEEVKYLIKNSGNVEESISLSSRSGKVVEFTKITLAAGKTAIVKTINELPFNNQEVKLVSFDLMCTIPDMEKPFVALFTVPILSFKTAKSDSYQRIPINASLVYNQFNTSTEKVGALFFDITGKDYLDRHEKHMLEFIARGPNRFDIPRFGSIDQYFVGYENKKWRIEAGDKMFVLSNIVENGRFSKGLDIKRKIGKTEVSAFYLNPRFFKDIAFEYGAAFNRTMNNNLKTEMLFVHKTHKIESQSKQTNFLNLNSFYEKGRFMSNGELSISKTGSKFSGGAYNNSKLELKRFKLYSTLLFTGKEYYGFFSNSLQVNASAYYRLNKKTSIGAAKNINHLNPSLDSYFYTVSPYFNNNNFSISYDINKVNKLRFNLISGSREDKMAIKTYHYQEKLFRYFYEVGSTIGLNLKLDGDMGQSLNLLKLQDERKFNDLYRYRGILGYSSLKNYGVSVFIEHLNTTRYEALSKNSKFWFYGINSQLRIKNALNLNLNYRNNYTPDEFFQTQSFFDASVSLTVRNHEFSAMGTYGFIPPPINDKNMFFSLRYTLRLNAPIRKKKGLGGLDGTVSGMKSAGVVLNLNGKKVISDEKGKFSFNDLLPGKYYLGTDRSSLGYGNIINVEMPYLVEIMPDKRNTVLLDVVKTGKVIGKIKYVGDKELELANIMIEIYSPGFSKLTTTDMHGFFQFSELKEDNYQIRIVSDTFNKMFTKKNPDLFILVKKGEDAPFTINLEEKKKKINFQKEKITIIDDKN